MFEYKNSQLFKYGIFRMTLEIAIGQPCRYVGTRRGASESRE